jgi:hypothetical protein
MPALQNHLTGPFYPLIGTMSATPGQTIVHTLTYSAGPNHSITNSLTQYSSNVSITGSATFVITIPLAAADTAVNYYYFGSNGIPYWNTSTHSGHIKVNVSSLPACSVAASGTISVSIETASLQLVIATISGVTAGANCALYTRATEYGAHSQGNRGPWSAGVIHEVARGSSYIFEAANTTYINNVIASAPILIPYLATDMTVGVTTANVEADNDGNWQQTVTGHDNETLHNNYRVYSGTTPLMRAPPLAYQYLNTGVGGSLIDNTWTGNTPEVGETLTLTLWGGRTSASGGSGIPGFATTGTTFTVTRAEGTHSEGDPADGTYFDNDLSTGAIHTVTLSSLTQNWYYNISASSVYPNPPLSTWADDAATTKTVTDASASIPSGTNVTTTPYYLWRSENANGSSPEYTEQTYNRSLANYDRFSFSDSTVTLADTDTTFTQTINNTIDGHTYYIYSGSSIVGTGIATGTTLAIGCTEVGVPNPGDEVTHTLKTLSPANSVPTSAYSTGTTYTVTRTGTGSGSGEGADPSPYGLEVFNAAGTTKLYDTTSRGGRIMASGTIPSSGTLAYEASQTINVSGLANSTDYNITIVPLHGGTGSGLAGYAGYIFDLTKSNGSFTITNNSGIANAYYYYVIKSGGS